MNVLYLQSMCSLLIVTFHPPQELSVVGGKYTLLMDLFGS